MMTAYSIVLVLLTVYSFALVDPNMTFINHPLWETFRNAMVQLGYHHRMESWYIFLALFIALAVFHFYFMKHVKSHKPVKIAIIVGMTLLLSYPFLSHDLFNYMFDARILTHYGANPYTHKALDFPNDPWLRFLQWTHRTYPYGPTFLPITIVASLIGLGTFILNFISFKLLSVVLYIGTTFVLSKLKKEWALFFATHPLVLLEGVVNAHNDLAAVFFAIVGIWYLVHEKGYAIKGRVSLLISAGIKYMTLPVIVLRRPSKSEPSTTTLLAIAGMACVVLYLTFRSEIQPWYFLNFFIFIPYAYGIIKRFYVFLIGILISYYPYIALGGWEKRQYVELKHTIILAVVILQVIVLLPLISAKIKRSS